MADSCPTILRRRASSKFWASVLRRVGSKAVLRPVFIVIGLYDWPTPRVNLPERAFQSHQMCNGSHRVVSSPIVGGLVNISGGRSRKCLLIARNNLLMRGVFLSRVVL